MLEEIIQEYFLKKPRTPLAGKASNFALPRGVFYLAICMSWGCRGDGGSDTLPSPKNNQ